MSASRWVLIIIGIIMLLFGTVFALQGANIVGGSSLMDGNTTYIYLGAVVAVIGLLLIGVGGLVARSRGKSVSSSSASSGQSGSA